MITRPYLFDGLLFGILIYFFDNLSIVFHNPEQLFLSKDTLLKVVRHTLIEIRRIT